MKMSSAPPGYRCPKETPMSCMEVLGFVDRRMLEHRDAAVLENFGTDDGEGGEGESLFKLA